MREHTSLILDFETTGVDANRDRIIEVGLILTDFKQMFAATSTMIDCGWDFGHLEANGISYSETLGKPSISDIAPFLYICYLMADEIVAYNARFDLSFLRAEFNAIGLRLVRKTVYDPYANLRCSLQEACGRYRIPVEDVQWHTAMGDCVALYRLYTRLRGDREEGESSGGGVTLAPRFS